mgnify:CR=1 FL=1
MAVDVGLLVLVVAGAGTALGIRTSGVSILGSPPVCKHSNVDKAENKEKHREGASYLCNKPLTKIDGFKPKMGDPIAYLKSGLFKIDLIRTDIEVPMRKIERIQED